MNNEELEKLIVEAYERGEKAATEACIDLFEDIAKTITKVVELLTKHVNKQ